MNDLIEREAALECCLKPKVTPDAEIFHALKIAIQSEINHLPSIMPKFGKWKQIPSGMTPGGTPVFACAACGGSEHLHGTEYPERKMICDSCGLINYYPWEKIIEEMQ